ncbi:MAG TPA: MFS transporter [Propionibacteriaceae bacterium]
MFSRLTVPATAALWGLQFAFFTPALALILTTLYGATTAEVGLALAAYNGSGFIASLIIPALADRRGSYLAPMLGCAIATVALAVALTATTSLPVAVVALVVFGGPGGVGISLLYAHLRHSGARPSDVVNIRAVVSVSWIAGPPLATLIIGAFGHRGVLVALATVAVLNVVTTAGMIGVRRRSRDEAVNRAPPSDREEEVRLSRSAVAIVVAAFVLLQAGNATVLSVLTLYVVDTLQLDVRWAGAALGLAAGLEVPALLIMGRLVARFSSLGLIITGALAGVCYYVGIALITGPVMLLVLQLLNAWSFAAITGAGLPLFQQIIPRPGLSTGLFTNTRRIGALLSGPIIAFGSLTPIANRGIFVTCAAVSVIALALVGLASRGTRPAGRGPEPLDT